MCSICLASGPGFSLRSLVTPSGSRRRRKRLWLHDQIRCGHLLVRRCRCCVAYGIHQPTPRNSEQCIKVAAAMAGSPNFNCASHVLRLSVLVSC
ncbi:uncharacterized protein [Dermacentor albipictus]|uniref:uncharacterized protein isoform X1 n=1 Tax=Dermacentor albipictus TaxID=60249 RepID=UPI0038FBFB31